MSSERSTSNGSKQASKYKQFSFSECGTKVRDYCLYFVFSLTSAQTSTTTAVADSIVSVLRLKSKQAMMQDIDRLVFSLRKAVYPIIIIINHGSALIGV